MYSFDFTLLKAIKIDLNMNSCTSNYISSKFADLTLYNTLRIYSSSLMSYDKASETPIQKLLTYMCVCMNIYAFCVRWFRARCTTSCERIRRDRASNFLTLTHSTSRIYLNLMHSHLFFRKI